MYFVIYVPYVISGVSLFILHAHSDNHNVTIIHMITTLYSHNKQPFAVYLKIMADFIIIDITMGAYNHANQLLNMNEKTYQEKRRTNTK